MADLAPLAMDFLRSLNKSIRALRTYAPTHPQARTCLGEALASLQRMLQEEPTVTIGTREGLMIVQSAAVRDSSSSVKAFCEMLAARNISTFTIQRGATSEDFAHLVKLMAMSPDDLLLNDAIRPELIEPLRTIRLNEMRFVAVQEGMEGGELTAMVSGGSTLDNLSLFLASMLTGAPKGGPVDPAGGGGIPGSPGAALPPGFVAVPAGSVTLPPGTEALPPGFVTVPAGSVTLPPGTEAPPPGFVAVPAGSVTLPPGTEALPPGFVAVPAGSVTLAPGTEALPPGFVAVPAGSATLPPGTVAMPAGPAALPPGFVAVPAGSVTLPPGTEALPPGTVAISLGSAGLRALAGAVGPILKTGQRKEALEAVSRAFDQIVERSFAGFTASDFVGPYLEGAGALPDAVKQALFASPGNPAQARDPKSFMERLPMALRGRLVTEDLQRGQTSMARLRDVVKRLAPSPEEFTQLIEVVSRALSKSGGSTLDAQQRLSRVLELLPLTDDLKRTRRTALVVVPNPEELLSITQSLEEAGFLVTSGVRAPADAGALIESRAIDVAILDISTAPLSEVPLLPLLARDPTACKVLMLEDILRVRGFDEMEPYLEFRILYKPIDIRELAAAVQEMAPSLGAAPAPPATPDEVERARQIHRHFLPHELTDIPGYSLALRYEPTLAIGGNIYESLPLPGGSFGLLIADVTGTSVMVARAAIAVLTSLRRIAPSCSSAAETMARLNEDLTSAIPRGLLVRALYGILEPEQGRLTLVNCGHPCPLLTSRTWRSVKPQGNAGPALRQRTGTAFEKALHPATITLAPGDHLIFYTSGVLETAQPPTEEGAALWIEGNVQTAPMAEGAGRLVAELVESLMSRRNLSPDSDDLVILDLHRTGVETAPASSEALTALSS